MALLCSRPRLLRKRMRHEGKPTRYQPFPSVHYENGVYTFVFGAHKVRAILDAETGAPMFVAKEVAEALGYADPQQAVKLQCKYPKSLNSVVATELTSSPRGITIIPEKDVYRLIMRSQLHSAVAFQKWVTKEVLPSIRKHGAYMTPTKIGDLLHNPDSIIALATALKEEQQKAKALAIRLEETMSWNSFNPNNLLNLLQTLNKQNSLKMSAPGSLNPFAL